jgi:hypothetical protein
VPRRADNECPLLAHLAPSRRPIQISAMAESAD